MLIRAWQHGYRCYFFLAYIGSGSFGTLFVSRCKIDRLACVLTLCMHMVASTVSLAHVKWESPVFPVSLARVVWLQNWNLDTVLGHTTKQIELAYSESDSGDTCNNHILSACPTIPSPSKMLLSSSLYRSYDVALWP